MNVVVGCVTLRIRDGYDVHNGSRHYQTTCI